MRALGILFLWTLVACAANTAPKYTEVPFQLLARYNGFTYCTEKGVFSMVTAGLSAIEEADTKAHEAKHREQFHRLNRGCRAFQEWYEQPENKLAAEVEAFHAGWCVAGRMGADTMSLRQAYVERVGQYFGGGVNRLQIIQAFLALGGCH